MIRGLKVIDDILKGLPENARLRAELEQKDALIAKLQAALSDAQAEIQRLQPDRQDMSADTSKVLRLFFETGRDLSIPQVAQQFGFQASVAEFHFDILRQQSFIRQTRAGMHTYGGSSPPLFGLTSEGRAYVMQHR